MARGAAAWPAPGQQTWADRRGAPQHQPAGSGWSRSRKDAEARLILPVLLQSPWLLAAMWIAVLLSGLVLIVTQVSPAGWDLHVYANAVRSLGLGHDPYADGIAVQKVFHLSPLAHQEGVAPPYTYVYSPLTLPLIRLIGHLPLVATGAVYWLLYLAAVVATGVACVQIAEPRERAALALLAPASPFFPGLMQNNVVMSGNVVYMVYALVLCTALLGWRRGRWVPFYAVVLLASCIKAPLLTLVMIPVLSARGQWLLAGAVSAIGLALFAVQPAVWPGLFRNYLEAVSLQFSYNHDFGLSPSGLLGNTLYFFGKPYTAASTVFYCAYGLAVLATLLVLSRRYLRGQLTLEQWAPVLLMGVVLLNPRIKEYDVAVLALPMAMVMWRVLRWRLSRVWSMVVWAAVFLCINGLTNFGGEVWKPVTGAMLVLLFVAGSWRLLSLGSRSAARSTDVNVDCGMAVAA